MPILRVEELEQRRVLSGGLSHASTPAHPSDYNGSSLQASGGAFAEISRLTINFSSPTPDTTTIVLLGGNNLRPMFVIAIETIVFVHMPMSASGCPRHRECRSWSGAGGAISCSGKRRCSASYQRQFNRADAARWRNSRRS